MTGRTERGVSFGVLDAVLMPTKFRLQNLDTKETFRRQSTPWTNAAVFRLTEELSSNADVGVLATAFNPGDEEGAYSTGLDWNFLTKERQYALRGQIAASYQGDGVLGNEGSQGAGGMLKFNKEKGEHFKFYLNYETFTPGFNPNALGYLRRDDLHLWRATVEYWQMRPVGPFYYLVFQVEPFGEFNYAGDNLGQKVTTKAILLWKNNWQTVFYGTVGPKYVDDRETRGGPLLKRPTYGEAGGYILTDNRYVIGGELAFNWIHMPIGYQLSPSLTLTLRLSRLEVTAGATYTYVEGDEAWVDTLTDSNGSSQTIIGRRDLNQLDFTLTSTLVILRDLTFQMSGQLLLATIDYSEYGELQSDSSVIPTDYPDDSADFSLTDLRVQALLRFEYLPGSAVYAGYTLAGNSFFHESEPNMSFILDDVRDQEREHIFMIKVSHHFG